ncbi:hypothetical protein [Fuerstiella marisgermanici]|uniref:Uncharacterized protein n=1 Tax=Fuerstiella marisgermanici TaxID=1891926 RepID=A0A1P8WE36_9PLAN|nr:hypothetical protein [Fuerstiella marisgermanici]APZ92338.1 hypothetical protein Fuma_01948 [Fuerstiella marisgermanici]
MLRFVSALTGYACKVVRTAAFCVAISGVLHCVDINAAEFESLRLGLQGQGKVGTWLPISATATDLPAGQLVELQAAFPDPRGDNYVETTAVAVVPNSGMASLHGYFRSGRIEGTGVVSLVDSETGETLVRRTVLFGEDVALPDPEVEVQRRLQLRRMDALTLLTVGGGAGGIAGVEEFLRNAAVYSRDRSILQSVQLGDPSELPDDVDGLDAVDVILMADKFETSPQQAGAIQQWVRDGGRLIVSTGGTVDKFLASDVGRWVGEHFGIEDAPIAMRRFNGLEAFVSGATRIQTNLSGKDSWPVARLTSGQTKALVDSLDGPILGTQSIGAGIITVLAVDINQLPLNRWTSLPQFLEVLVFGEKLSPTSADRRRTSRVSQSGVSDLGTQWLAANDAVPIAGQWSTWSVMAMLAAWLILIGPLDFLLVTKVLKRPHLTWLTFPFLIVCGVMLMVQVAGKSGQLGMRQLDVLDVMEDGNSSYLHARSWLSVSASETMRAEFHAEPTLELPGMKFDHATKTTKSDASDASAANKAAAVQLTWSGRPEDVFGAMYRKGGMGLGQQTFRHSRLSPDTVTNMPLLTNGSRSFKAAWHASGPQPLVESSLTVSGFGLLKGTFHHNLPEPITDWIVVHGNRVYRAQPTADEYIALDSNTSWTARADGIYASDLKAYLTGTRTKRTKESKGTSRGSSQVTTPYDAQSTDAQYVLTMLSLYNYAGGAEYAGLSHTQYRRMEVTDTARLNHAVLIGRIDLPVSSLSINDQPITNNERQTLVRLFIPVDKRPPGARAKTKEDLDKEQQVESENQQ